MLNIILFGPPGAGKGTQSTRLIEKYNLVHISTGDIFRANMKGGTELGNLAKSYIDKGQLVPDEVTIKMLESEVKKHPNVNGFIFDGYPRNIVQASALDQFLSELGLSITLLTSLEVDKEELFRRLLERGKLSGRTDDQNPDVIRKRIEVYTNETAPVIEYYSKQNKHVAINGIGEIDEITNRLCNVINSCKVK